MCIALTIPLPLRIAWMQFGDHKLCVENVCWTFFNVWAQYCPGISMTTGFYWISIYTNSLILFCLYDYYYIRVSWIIIFKSCEDILRKFQVIYYLHKASIILIQYLYCILLFTQNITIIYTPLPLVCRTHLLLRMDTPQNGSGIYFRRVDCLNSCLPI